MLQIPMLGSCLALYSYGKPITDPHLTVPVQCFSKKTHFPCFLEVNHNFPSTNFGAGNLLNKVLSVVMVARSSLCS